MVLEVHLADQADLRTIAQIHHDSFVDEFSLSIYPHTPAGLEFRYQRHLNNLENDPRTRIIKCIDTEADDKIIAFGYWLAPKKEGEESKVPDLIQQNKWPEGVDGAFVEAFYAQVNQLEHDVMGERPHYYLSLMGTAAGEERRGAAHLIIKWGEQQADRDGVPCMVFAYDFSSKPIFDRLGWQEHVPFVLNGQRWATCMTREPKKAEVS